MNRWVTLARREFQEARSLWMAPLVAAVGLVVMTIIITAKAGDPGFGFVIRGGRGMLDASLEHVAGLSVLSYAIPILAIGLLAQFAYLLDALYAERRDRSILFWKSLPVSDLETVLSKVLVGMVLTPALLVGVAIVTHLLCAGIGTIGLRKVLPMGELWHADRLLRAYGSLAARVAVNALWYAPGAAYALLASVLSRKSPWLTALLPMLLIVIVERMLLSSHVAMDWLALRNRPVIDVAAALQSAELWAGVGVAAAGLIIVVYLRRWRDDA